MVKKNKLNWALAKIGTTKFLEIMSEIHKNDFYTKNR